MAELSSVAGRSDILVIGGGLIGCSIALECARRGRTVTVLEKLDQVGQGSTARSTAIIRQLYHETHSIKLAIEGLRLWEQWSKHTGHDVELVRFHQPGILWVVKPEALATMPVRTMKELGAEVEVMDEPSMTRRFPSYRFSGPLAGSPVCGLFEKRGGYVEDPSRAVRNIAEAARRAGVRFHTGETVTSVEHDDAGCGAGTGGAGAGGAGAGGAGAGGAGAEGAGAEGAGVGGTSAASARPRRVTAIITSSGRRFEADTFVNAGGPHSAAVNTMAGCPMPLATAPNRQQFVEGRETALDWNGARDGSYPVCADPVSGIYFRPSRTQFRVGTVLAEDDRHFVTDADAPLPEPTPEFITDKLERLRRRQPGARVLDVRGTSALYDVTLADWCPILDKSDLDGWFVAIGTSGKWFKSGPVIGWIMAELIEWVRTGKDPDKPTDRLTLRLPRTGHELALADFARWRKPHGTEGVLA